jgi:hypothetical protein
MTSPSLPPTTPPGAGPSTPGVGPYEPPVVQPVTPARPKRSNAGGFLLTVAAVIAVGGIAFAVGRVTAPATTNAVAGANGFGNGGFGNGGFGNGANGGPGSSFAPGEGFAGRGGLRGAIATEATVTAVAPDHLTIQIGNSGQTIDVKTDSSTTYHTQQAATSSAVTAGSKVLIQFQPATASASGASPAPAASGAPGGGFAPRLGTVKDVTVLAP